MHQYTSSNLNPNICVPKRLCVYVVHLKKKEKRCQSFRWEIKNISIYYSDMKNLNAYTLFCELIEICSVWRDDGHTAYKRTEIIHKSAQTHVQSRGRTKDNSFISNVHHINNSPHPSDTL